jgi:exonuclease III
MLARRPADTQARYIEAAVGGVLIASIDLPNGNPQLVRSSTTSSSGSGV